MYITDDPRDPVGRLENALTLIVAAEPIEKRLETEFKVRLKFDNYERHVQTGVERGVITEDEADAVRAAEAARHDCILVDEFEAAPAERQAAHLAEAVAEQA
jgi:hypothetical protein